MTIRHYPNECGFYPVYAPATNRDSVSAVPPYTPSLGWKTPSGWAATLWPAGWVEEENQKFPPPQNLAEWREKVRRTLGLKSSAPLPAHLRDITNPPLY